MGWSDPALGGGGLCAGAHEAGDQKDGAGRQVQPDVVATQRHDIEALRERNPKDAENDEERADAARCHDRGGRRRGSVEQDGAEQDVDDVVQRIDLEQPEEGTVEDESREAGNDVHHAEDGRDGPSHAHGRVNLPHGASPRKGRDVPVGYESVSGDQALARRSRRAWTRVDTVVVVAITLAAAVLRLASLGRPVELVFDEIFYPRDACWYVVGTESTCGITDLASRAHPPLGKWLIGSGIAAFGYDPFGWRVASAVIGTAAIPLVYLLGWRLLRPIMTSTDTPVGAAAAAGVLT